MNRICELFPYCYDQYSIWYANRDAQRLLYTDSNDQGLKWNGQNHLFKDSAVFDGIEGLEIEFSKSFELDREGS